MKIASAVLPATRHLLENRLLAALGLLLLLALAGPAIHQPATYHDFADHRAWGSLPFAMDVLSNLPFAIWGAMGLWLAWPAFKPGNKALAHQRDEARLGMLFFSGLLVTAVCSTWYHLGPNDASLAIDRCGMVVAFAGLVGMAAAGRVSSRAGWALATALLIAGLLSVAVWSATANVTPWAVMQFGGMALVVWFALLERRPGSLQIRWGLVIGIYALAKVLEIADHPIYEFTGHLVSGHSLKHVVAAFAAWPVAAALWQRRS